MTRGDDPSAAELLAQHRAEACGHWLFESLDARLLASRGAAGQALEKVTRFARADASFERLLFEAQLRCEVGDADGCLATLERAREIQGRDDLAQMSFARARLYASLGKGDLVRGAVGEALDAPPDGVRKRLVAARLLFRAGLPWDAAMMLPPILRAGWRRLRRG